MLFVAPLLWACDGGPLGPYLEFAGGGFVFNYRTANHFYGFVVRQKRPLPEGSRLRATFELPGGGRDIQEIVTVPGRLQYKFQTGDLDGIIAGHAYNVSLALVDGATGADLERLEKTFTTEIDQSSLPSEPLVIGPGYQQPKP